ncbi:Hsp33 family molecular chaperone HslO [Fundicoccus culcitae]|uniref:33 kDa chaperonin n=1 Tax=Fundicoccus culcitae TaxID=2969821 RepID=A0ABY5P2Q1_9LACT|nr:Hsp33 family molecular chaperone HslO [Fundicoccus culcitae]UUX32881.1 Hsp33 family molecular chaperone HslO [Fundicoccus culcitae]
MADKLLRALAFDKQIRVYVVDATQMVAEAQQRHKTWHTATAALGRTLVATTLLAGTLKGDDRITVEILGDGPIGHIVADGNASGDIRGYVANPEVALALNADGKLDVAAAVGLPGTLVIRKYIGDSEPFSGQVPLISGELAEDFTYYMALSEQTPSSIGLSVLVDTDETVKVAGGFMIQVMPGATEETIATLENRLAKLGRFSDLLDKGLTLEMLLGELVGEDQYEILTETAVRFYCDCSKERFAKSLMSVGRQELEAMIHEDHGAEVVCHFCNEHYQFNEAELQALID